MIRYSVILAILIGSAVAAPVGSVHGFVKDSSGAVVPRVSLTLTSLETNLTRQTSSNDSGFYEFAQLPPGTYSLSAESQGFRKATLASVPVLVDRSITVDMQLEVGAITETVQVTGSSSLIETDKTSTGANIEQRMVQNLPLGGRRFDDLAVMTPGVTLAPKGTQAGGFAAAGSRPGSINSMIDGINNVDRQVGGPVTTYRIADAVREFSVTTTAASAEFGRESGGQVNIVTKSGTNQLHGSGFWFVRNDALEANNFFTNKLGGTKRKLRLNQYGGTIGGPIKRDRTFFFYSWEAQQLNNPSPVTAVVPTAAERASVRDPIAQKLLSYFPMPTVPGAAAGTTNYIGNAPSTNSDNTHLARIDHSINDHSRLTGRYMWYGGDSLSGGTLPSTGGSTNKPGSQNLVLAENHIFSPTLITELRLGYSRNLINIQPQDLGFNAASILTGVPGVVDATQDKANSGIPNISITGGYATLGSATNVPQARTLNTYELFASLSKTAPFGWSRHTIKTGFEARREEAKRYINGAIKGSINFASFANFAGTCAACNGQALINTSSKQTGDSLGYWYRYPLAWYLQDDIKVTTNLTLNLGIRYELPSNVVEKSNRGTNFWDGIGPVLVNTNQMLNVDPTKTGPGAIYYKTAAVTLPRAGTTSDYNNIAPIFGFAYTPRFNAGPGFVTDGKTVVRGGFRISYDETYNNVTVNQTINPPWNLTTTQRAGTTQPAAGYGWNVAFDQNVPLVVRTTQGPGAPAVGLLTFNGLDNHAPTAYAYNWNFGVQRQVTDSIYLDVSYLASAGHKLGNYLNPNQPSVIIRDPSFRGAQAPNEQIFPFPQFGSVRSAAFQSNSIWNGLVVSGKIRKGSLFLGGSYTWSHGIDNASSFAGSTGDTSQPDNRYRTDLERSNSASDQRHRFVAYWVYTLPFGKGQRYLSGAHGVVQQVLGGWQLSGIGNMATGQPFTVYANTGIDFSGFNTFLDRPDIVGTGPLAIHESNPDAFFDPAYFGKVAGNPLCPGYSAASGVRVNSGCAPAGRVGTSPRNAYYGPGLINFDASLQKSFPITERLALRYRAEFFNLDNHTNFSLVAGNFAMSSGTFGQMSATSAFIYGAPRVIQMTLRLDF